MAYNWTGGNPLVDGSNYPQAAMINEIRNILDNMNNYKCSAYMSTNQSINNNTGITTAYDTKVYDPNINFSTSNHNYTCPFSGYYLIVIVNNFIYNTTGARSFGIYKNGVSAAELQTGAQTSSGSPNTGGILSRILSLSAGDTIATYVYQNSGGSLNLVGDSVHCTVDINFISTN